MDSFYPTGCEIDLSAGDYVEYVPLLPLLMSTPGLNPPPTTRSLMLIPAFQRQFIAGTTDGFRLRMTATAQVNMDNNIFLYLATPLQPGATTYDAVFQKVCSPADMASYPVGIPAPSGNPPWFRLYFVELDFYTRKEAQYVHDAIVADTNQLLTTLKAMDTLDPGEAVVITVS